MSLAIVVKTNKTPQNPSKQTVPNKQNKNSKLKQTKNPQPSIIIYICLLT